MTFTHFLVVGANRGIGYELAHQLLQNPKHKVVATYRDASKLDDLNKLVAEQANHGRLLLTRLDMNDAESCQSAAAEVQSNLGNLDVAIVNAGVIMKSSPLLTQNLNGVADIFENNVLGPLRVCQAFVPLLRGQSSVYKLVLMSSDAGSITVQKNLKSPAYGISKAALNMAGRKLAAELESSNVTVVLLHPGWVQTEMGGPGAQITPEESVAGMLKVIDQLSMTHSGEFWVYNGEKHPW
ncbi:hypothetical protein FRC12_021145 [Ceratobasidium sp. 428]|nr:hypothetical protein FRC12_021145 [Ceratobasidium sp. 428]